MLLVLLSGNPTERTDEHIVGVAGTILLPSEGVRVLAHRATHGRVALGANIPEFPIQLGNVPLLKRDREVVVGQHSVKGLAHPRLDYERNAAT